MEKQGEKKVKLNKESGELVYEELALLNPFHVLLVILNIQDLM